MKRHEFTRLLALVERWERPVGATDDDPAYDDGRESGQRSCADALREFLEEREAHVEAD